MLHCLCSIQWRYFLLHWTNVAILIDALTPVLNKKQTVEWAVHIFGMDEGSYTFNKCGSSHSWPLSTGFLQKKSRHHWMLLHIIFPICLPSPNQKGRMSGMREMIPPEIYCPSEIVKPSVVFGIVYSSSTAGLGKRKKCERNCQENGDNEDKQNLFLWYVFPTLIGRCCKPPKCNSLADESTEVLCLFASACFWHTGVSVLFSQEAAFFPHPSPAFFCRGREFLGRWEHPRLFLRIRR